MDENERAVQVERLRQRLSEAMNRKAALLDEARALGARLHEIRAAFGNPFSYSDPENAGESAANFTGHSSHAVVFPTLRALRNIDHELQQMKERLRAFGVSH